MSKSLIIAEKPSVAEVIYKALGGKGNNTSSAKVDYFEHDDYLICSALGHLVEIYNPDEETLTGRKNKKSSTKKSNPKWSFENLPVLPAKFELRPMAKTKDRIKLLKDLVQRDDVTEIINACDAGREGELIFYYLAKFLNIKQKQKRMWLQSMTQDAIKKEASKPKQSSQFLALQQAAIARSEADWLVGINATRALTLVNTKGTNSFVLTTVGRVQTPTLALIITREQLRKQHKERDYWQLVADFKVNGHSYQGTRQKPNVDETDPEDSPSRIWDKESAEKLLALCSNETTASVTETTKDRKINPPALFDLNDLQREANKRFSFPARRTLEIAQSLYDQYKVLTYPRTESRHLPNDYQNYAKDVLANFASENNQWQQITKNPNSTYFFQQSQDNKSIKRVFDDKKISDHFAIVPTGTIPKDLPEDHAKIFDLVLRRFNSAFMPPAIVAETERVSVVAGEKFISKGRVIKEHGWYKVGMPNRLDNELPVLPKSNGAIEVALKDCNLEQKTTKPPPRYTDATLLGAMQRASSLVEDTKLSKMLSSSGGLGTPATRASIIEELIRHGYVERVENEFHPRPKAFTLIDELEQMQIKELTKPELTATWEQVLRDIENGKADANEFLNHIRDLVKEIIDRTKDFDLDKVEEDENVVYATLSVKCPNCGGTVVEGKRKYICQNKECQLYFWKVVANRALSQKEAEQLLLTHPNLNPDSKKTIGPFDDLYSKKGTAFSASLYLDAKGRIKMQFVNNNKEQIDDVSKLETIGSCPLCGKNVVVAPNSYSCQDYFDEHQSCSFSIQRLVCKRELTIEEVKTLLAEPHKTALLENFISKWGKPFKAYLKINPKSGRLGFEFEARKKGSKKSAKKAKKSSKSSKKKTSTKKTKKATVTA